MKHAWVLVFLTGSMYTFADNLHVVHHMDTPVPHVGLQVYLVWGWPVVGARTHGRDGSDETLNSPPVVHLHDESPSNFPLLLFTVTPLGYLFLRC